MMDDVHPGDMTFVPDLPVGARVDGKGRLVAADTALLNLQRAAGKDLGDPIALPALADLVNDARGDAPVRREIMVGTPGGTVRLDVTVFQGGAFMHLEITDWKIVESQARRGAATNRQVARHPRFAFGPDLQLTRLDPPFAGEGRLTRVFRLLEGEDGELPLLAAIAARTPCEGQRAAYRADNDRQVRLVAAPHIGAAGEYLGYQGYIAELGDSAAARPMTGDSAPAKESFDATLRTPLSRIVRAADDIIERADGPLRSDYAHYAGDIATAGRHLMSVVGSMGEQVTRHRSVDVVRLAAEAIGLVTAKARDKQVDIELLPDEDAALAMGEAAAIRQILVNILGNAVRHSPEGGTIAVVFGHAPGNLLVTIADQGPGISDADRNRIFQRFERAHSADDGGTGLGLAISRRLARSMQGDVTLESAPGEGARFKLILPAG